VSVSRAAFAGDELEAGRPVRLPDVLVFLAVTNFHFPLFELLLIGTPPGMLPIPIMLMFAAGLLSGRLSTAFSVLPYILAGTLYFAALGFLGVAVDPTGVYVTMMQTATMIAFLQYLLSMGPAGARHVVINIQKLLGIYIVVFLVLQIGILLSGSVHLFNQVAGSNYVGMLTTYVVLSLLRRPTLSARSKRLLGLSLIVNILGQQRASMLINGFMLALRYLSKKKSVLLLIVFALVVIYVLYAGQINSALSTATKLAGDYYSLALMELDDLEVVIRRSVTAEEDYDASALIRAFSLWYVGGEVMANPLSPISSREYGYLWNSHNLFLEYFKVGGLIFVMLSLIALFRRIGALIRRGYCTVSPLGVVLSLLYSMLFNDLFIAFVLLALSFERSAGRPREMPAMAYRPKLVRPASPRAPPVAASVAAS
jgi:hypothetical protein